MIRQDFYLGRDECNADYCIPICISHYILDLELLVAMAIEGLGNYFEFYNHQRLHQALDYQVPSAVYFRKGGD